MGDTSRMSRETHVRICEGLGVKFPGPTRRDPDRKGKVESGVAHAKKTPLKGQRFESLPFLNSYKVQGVAKALDHEPLLTPIPGDLPDRGWLIRVLRIEQPFPV